MNDFSSFSLTKSPRLIQSKCYLIPGDLPSPGTELGSPAPSEPPGKPHHDPKAGAFSVKDMQEFTHSEINSGPVQTFAEGLQLETTDFCNFPWKHRCDSDISVCH